MNTTTFFKRAALPLFLALAMGCGSSGPGGNEPDPMEPDPTDPEPEVTMTRGLAYEVRANDRLVNTSPDPAKVRVVLVLEEATSATHAQVTLLEGFADLFQ